MILHIIQYGSSEVNSAGLSRESGGESRNHLENRSEAGFAQDVNRIDAYERPKHFRGGEAV